MNGDVLQKSSMFSETLEDELYFAMTADGKLYDMLVPKRETDLN